MDIIPYSKSVQTIHSVGQRVRDLFQAFQLIKRIRQRLGPQLKNNNNAVMFAIMVVVGGLLYQFRHRHGLNNIRAINLFTTNNSDQDNHIDNN